MSGSSLRKDSSVPYARRHCSAHDFEIYHWKWLSSVSKTTSPQTLNLSPQSRPQADSPEMGTNWTQDSYCYSSFDIRKIFLEVAVCLSNDHVVLVVLTKMNNPIPPRCSCCSVSHVQLSVAHQALLSFTISHCLIKLMSIESVMPSKHLILPSPSPPVLSLSQQ